MTTRRVRGLMPTAALLFCLVALPVLASPSQTNGPLYTSPQRIQEAQRILESERYLRAGHYSRGEMDPNTVAALRSFQYDHFILNNGSLDQDTMAELHSHRPGTAPARIAQATAGVSAAGASSMAATSPSAERSMPVTGSPVPAMAGLGALLAGVGLVVLRWKRV